MSTQLDGSVVVGVAESVFKGWALRWAAEQARLEGRNLTLVNASGPVSGAWREHGMEALPGSSAILREHGEELLARARAVVEKAAPGLTVNEVFEITDPSTLLIQLSSTAHLLVAGDLLGYEDPGGVFTVMIQLGSILAVVWLYRARIVAVLRGPRWEDQARGTLGEFYTDYGSTTVG